LNEHLLGIIVGDMNPLSLIDSASFRHLVTLVVGGEEYFEAVGLRYPTAGEVRQMILDKFSDSKRLIKEELKKQSVVATTCDVWKTLRRTFVAVTAHWIDEATMTRFNCFLDVRVIDPMPTGDTIATILYEVHREFEVLGKVAYTTVGGSKFKLLAVILSRDGSAMRESAKMRKTSAVIVRYDANFGSIFASHSHITLFRIFRTFFRIFRTFFHTFY
jgi:hypothetical protein